MFLVKKSFPDSKIAEKFSCKRTKCTQIIKHAIAPSLEDALVVNCQKNCFSILCDESNDRGANKFFAILVRVYEEERRCVSTRFLDMPVVNIGTGQNLYDALDKCLSSRGIPWKNVLGFCSDNCSVMKGKKNSVLSRVMEAQPTVFDVGCICHLANLWCKAGVKVIPYPIDEMLSNIYFHFQHSSTRKEKYMEFLEFTETEAIKIVKHAETRWLSLQNCVTRTLHHWEALQSYFNSHPKLETDVKVGKIAGWLTNQEVKLYFYFLEFILVPLNEFNTTFQADARSNQFEDDNIAVGRECREYIREHIDDITPSTLNSFFRAVRNFYIMVTKKMINKFPFHDSTLQNLRLLNPTMKGKLSSNCVVDLVTRFPNIIDSSKIDQLQEEFDDFRVTPIEELPSSENGIDNFWVLMGDIKNPFTDSFRFALLSRLAIACCVIPTSNADPERIFSMLKKIQTDMRSELKNDTICSLMIAKQNQDLKCYEYEPSAEELKAAKKAVLTYQASLQ